MNNDETFEPTGYQGGIFEMLRSALVSDWDGDTYTLAPDLRSVEIVVHDEVSAAQVVAAKELATLGFVTVTEDVAKVKTRIAERHIPRDVDHPRAFVTWTLDGIEEERIRIETGLHLGKATEYDLNLYNAAAVLCARMRKAERAAARARVAAKKAARVAR